MVKIEFIAVVEDRRNEFKLRLGVDNSPNQHNNPMGYKLGLGLAQRGISNYNQLCVSLTYNYRIYNIGLQKNNVFKNKRELIKVK